MYTATAKQAQDFLFFHEVYSYKCFSSYFVLYLSSLFSLYPQLIFRLALCWPNRAPLNSNSLAVPFHREFLVALSSTNLSCFVKCWPIGTSFFPPSAKRNKVKDYSVLNWIGLVIECCWRFVDKSEAPPMQRSWPKEVTTNLRERSVLARSYGN